MPFRSGGERAELGVCARWRGLWWLRWCARRPRGPTTPGWTGRCGRDQRLWRGFDAPSPNWHRGHRGVDLAGVPGQPAYAAGAGTVVFAGELAGRPVVSVAHPGGLRTSYEPVVPSVRPGQLVAAGTALGELAAGHQGCPAPACLHWGAMWGPAPTPTTSIRSGCWPPRRFGSSRCTAEFPRDARGHSGLREIAFLAVDCRSPTTRNALFRVTQARGWAWSCTARSRATVTWV